MKKIYVLDTNVLLEEPEAIFSFDDNEVVIPEVVLEELDDFKKGREQINVNAREVARKLQHLKENAHQGQSLLTGVNINDGLLYIKSADKDIEMPAYWSAKRDNEILRTCLTLMKTTKVPVILVSKDVFLCIKADDLGIKNEDYRHESVVDYEEQYTGQMEVFLTDEDFNTYNSKGEILVSNSYQIISTDNSYEEVKDFAYYPNEFVIIHQAGHFNCTLLGRISKDKKYIRKLVYANQHPFGVTPRNASQIFIQEALMDSVNDTPLVIIKGPAGTAKTFFALAVGLEKVYNNNDGFRKILVCRPYQTMEEEIGFLPGTEQEKLEPMMRSVYDNLEILVDSDIDSRDDELNLQDKVQELFDRHVIEMQAVGFLRGRSIERQWVIIDEAQNVSASTAKAIVTRAGEGTKVILAGDIQQIDNQYLTRKNNGISYLVENLKNSGLVSVVSTSEKDIVRSPLAKEVVKWLEKDNQK